MSFDNDFDKQFNRITGAAILTTVVTLVLWMAGIAAVAYVAWHFISKYW